MQSNLAEDRTKLYTYADYLTWDDGQRWELIYGRAYLMAQPSPEHQKINKLLLRHMDLFFEGKSCEAYMPIDVRLFPQGDDSDYVVVQPDISVICQPDQLDRRGCKGAPTLVVEILSPSTASHDFVRKMHVYREAGIREYWIVDPEIEEIHIYLLREKRNRAQTFKMDEVLASPTFPGLEIPLSEIFP